MRTITIIMVLALAVEGLAENFTAMSYLFHLNFNSNFNESSLILHPYYVPESESFTDQYVGGVWRGRWRSNRSNFSQASLLSQANFEESQGKFVVASGKEKSHSFPQFKMFLYDGPYLSNLIVIIIDKEVVGFDENYLANISCNSAVLLYSFFDLKQSKECKATLSIKSLEGPFRNISISYASEECGLSFESGGMYEPFAVDFMLQDRLANYGWMLSTILGVNLMMGRSEGLRENAENKEYALPVGLYLIVWNLCVFVFHYSFFATYCAYGELMVPICFMFFYIFGALSNERTCKSFGDYIVTLLPRRCHCIFFIIVLFSLMLSIIGLVNLIMGSEVFTLVFLCMLWVPQIIANILSNRSPLTLKRMCGISLYHVAVPFYFGFLPNFLELRPKWYAIILPLAIILQIGIMVAQKFVRVKRLIKRLVYTSRVSTYDISSITPSVTQEQEPVVCPICLASLGTQPDGGSSETIETVKTPCRHAFHLLCLAEWLKRQDICPICRSKLPPIDDQPDDIF